MKQSDLNSAFKCIDQDQSGALSKCQNGIERAVSHSGANVTLLEFKLKATFLVNTHVSSRMGMIGET